MILARGMPPNPVLDLVAAVVVGLSVATILVFGTFLLVAAVRARRANRSQGSVPPVGLSDAQRRVMATRKRESGDLEATDVLPAVRGE